MEAFRTGQSADLLVGANWRKSRFSGASGNCVEIASLADGDVAVRQSTDPHGPALRYTKAELTAFVAGVKAGEFDDLVTSA